MSVERIEQARARGLTATEVVTLLGQPLAVVRAVFAVMDEAAAQRGDDPDRPGDLLRPHGTHSAFNRHRGRGEYPCLACATAEREYQAARHQRRVSERAGAAA